MVELLCMTGLCCVAPALFFLWCCLAVSARYRR